MSTRARDRVSIFKTIDVSRRARSDHMDEKQKVLLLPVVKKRRWITFELTGRREFIQPSPYQI
jgi:hypothetical protein